LAATDATQLPVVPAPRAAGHWRIAWRRLRRDHVAVGCGILFALVLFAVFPGAPLAERILGHGPNDFFPYAVSTSLRPVGPLAVVPDTSELGGDDPTPFEHAPPPNGTKNTLLLLGADSQLGRDEFLRLLYGGRVSLEVAIGAALLALLIGIALGSVAGFYGGLVDAVVSRFTDLVMAFPLLLLLILIGSQFDALTHWTLHGLLNKGVLQLVLLIGAFTWFYPARIVRTQVLSLRRAEFVEAAAMTGARDRRIIRTHLVPHVLPALIVYGTLLVATNVMIEVGVTFLGAGIKIPTSSWGTMLAQTWGSLLNPNPYNPATTQPWLTIVPSAAIFLTVFSLNQLGEGLREALDPKAQR
jgi:peptide/nickel transport system permease protein